MKITLPAPAVIVLFVLCSLLAKGQPANTNCGAALNLPSVTGYCSAAGQYTNVNGGVGTTFGKPACWPLPYDNTIERDVWFSFTAVAANVAITVNGNTMGLGTLNNPQVALYSGNCAVVLTTEACGVAAPGANTVTIGATTLIPGVTYLIRVDGENSNEGTFQLCVNNTSVSPIPSNDDCGAPITLSDLNNFCSSPAMYTNVLASNSSYGAPTCWRNTANDVWFQFTAIAPALNLTVNGSNVSPGTLNRPQVTLYSGTCLAVVFQEGCDTSALGSGTVSLNIGGLVVGTTYLIRVDGIDGNTGTFQLCINNFNPPVIPGQDCDTATPLCTTNSFTVTNISGFGADGQEAAGSCLAGGVSTSGNTEQNSVWYTWTAANSGTLTFDLIPTVAGTDIDFVVYEMNPATGCAGRTMIRCEAASCPGSTGLNATEVDVVEPFDCNPPNNNYLQQLNMTAGTTYGLLVNMFQTLGAGFTINFGGTGQFAGAVPEFTYVENPSCTFDKTVTFTDASTAATGYTWTFGPGASPSGASTGGPHTVTYSTPGLKTVTLSVTGVGGCDSLIYKQFIIEDTLSFTTTNVNSTCQLANGSITVNPAGGNGNISAFQYSINGGAFQIGNVFNGLSAGTYTITVRDSIGCLKSESVTLTTTVNPSVSITPVTPAICAGVDLVLNGNPSGGTSPYSTHTWSGTGSSSLISGSGTASPTFNNTIAGSYTLTYSVTDNSGCIGTATETIIVRPNPGASITPSPAMVCQGSNLSLNANPSGGSGVYSHSWNGSGSGSLIAGSTTATPTFNNANAGNYTLNYTVTDNQGCIGTATTSVTVNSNPVITSATGTNTSACGVNDGSITINATGTGLTYSINGGGSFVVGNVFNSLAAGSYPVVVRNSSGCSVSGGTISISSAGAPPAPIAIANPNPLCEGTTLSLSVTPVAGQTYNWTGPGGYTDIGSSVDRIGITVGMSGTYAVTATAGGCVSAAGTITVIVNSNPSASVTPASPQVCEGIDLNLNGNPSSGSGTYSSHVWSGTGAASINAGSSTATPTFNNSSPGSYGLIYTVTDNNGCSGSSTVTIIVNSNPLASITPAPATVCAGIDLYLNGNPSGGSGTYSSSVWTGFGASSLTGSNTATPIFNNMVAGSYFLTYTVTDNNGCIDTTGITVIVNANPTTNITPFPADVCAGADLVLNANPAGGTGIYSDHAWSGSGASSLVAGDTTATPTFNNASTGSFLLTYTVTDYNGCTGTSSATMTVHPNPTASITPSPATTCAGVDLVLNGNPAGGSGIYTSNIWTGSGAGALADSTTVTPVYNSSAGSYTLTYIVTDSKGCSGTGSTTIIVNENPSAVVTPSPANVCAGNDVVLNGNPSGGTGTYTTHLWSGAGSGSLIAGSTSASPTFNNSIAGNYSLTYSVTDNNGCINSAGIIVTVNENPVASISPSPAETCIGSDLILNGNPSGGSGVYTINDWTGAGAASLTSGVTTSSPTFNSATAGTYSIDYSVTDNNGCVGAASATIIVNANPTATFSPSPAIVCAGVDLVLSGNPAGGSGIYVFNSWTDTGAVSLISGDSTFAPTFNNSVAGNYPLTYTVTDNNGCSGSVSGSVTVNSAPPTPSASSPSAYCAGNTIADLTAGGTGGTLTWYNDSGLTSIVGSGSPFSSGATNNTTFYVTETVSGCQSLATPVTITVNPLPVAPLASSPASYCQGSLVADLTAAGAGGIYTWYSDAGLTNQVGTGSSFSSGATSTTTYYVTETIAGCQGPATSVTISINPLPAAPSASSPAAYCPDTPIADLTVSGTGGIYNWYSDAALINHLGTGSSFSTGTTTTTTFYVTETVSGCESSATLVTITVYVINADFSFTPSTGPAPLTVEVYNNNPGASSWNWSFSNGDSVSAAFASTTYNSPGSYTIIYTIEENGCMAMDSVTILVYEDLFLQIPNIFTPNGDNLNDDFKVTAEGIESYSIEIYSRWGAKIFSAQNQDNSWKGKINDGSDAHDGTYYFIITYKPIGKEKAIQKGFVNLVR